MQTVFHYFSGIILKMYLAESQLFGRIMRRTICRVGFMGAYMNNYCTGEFSLTHRTIRPSAGDSSVYSLEYKDLLGFAL